MLSFPPAFHDNNFNWAWELHFGFFKHSRNLWLLLLNGAMGPRWMEGWLWVEIWHLVPSYSEARCVSGMWWIHRYWVQGRMGSFPSLRWRILFAVTTRLQVVLPTWPCCIFPSGMLKLSVNESTYNEWIGMFILKCYLTLLVWPAHVKRKTNPEHSFKLNIFLIIHFLALVRNGNSSRDAFYSTSNLCE